MTQQQLNQQFGIDDFLYFNNEKDKHETAVLTNRYGSVTVALYGGQIISYLPVDAAHDLLFLSSRNDYSPGKAIRGGIPICWPWFGDDTSGYGRPAHGFARNHNWQVKGSGRTSEDSVYLILSLTDTENTLSVWPHPFELSITITLSDELSISLTSKNTGKQAFELTQAFHSYFNISDVDNVIVEGLKNCHYLDKLEDFSRKTQFDDLKISQEVDRIYCDTPKTIVLKDSAWQRQLEITSAGSKKTVVWNPWSNSSLALADLNPDDYRGFLCIETANAAGDKQIIESGESHTMSVSYRLS